MITHLDKDVPIQRTCARDLDRFAIFAPNNSTAIANSFKEERTQCMFVKDSISVGSIQAWNRNGGTKLGSIEIWVGGTAAL